MVIAPPLFPSLKQIAQLFKVIGITETHTLPVAFSKRGCTAIVNAADTAAAENNCPQFTVFRQDNLHRYIRQPLEVISL